jgi:hypothetical protein
LSFFSKLFGAGEADLEKAKRFLDEAERLADDENPLLVLEYVRRKSRGLQKAIGPDGPFHDRFIRILHKAKSRVFAGSPDAAHKAERNWQNLPSVLQMPLFEERVAIGALLGAARGDNKDLLWFIPAASPLTSQDAKTMIDYTFHFTDNEQLVLQFHQWNGSIVVRRSFFIEMGAQLRSRTIGDLVVDLMKAAHARGLGVESI